MTPEELRQEVAKEAKEAHEHKTAMEALIYHPGWLILASVLEAQIANRVSHVMSGPTTAETEWEKGEASGLKLARALPEILLEVATSIVPPEIDDDSRDAEDREPEFPWDDGDDTGYAGRAVNFLDH